MLALTLQHGFGAGILEISKSSHGWGLLYLPF